MGLLIANLLDEWKDSAQNYFFIPRCLRSFVQQTFPATVHVLARNEPEKGMLAMGPASTSWPIVHKRGLWPRLANSRESIEAFLITSLYNESAKASNARKIELKRKVARSCVTRKSLRVLVQRPKGPKDIAKQVMALRAIDSKDTVCSRCASLEIAGMRKSTGHPRQPLGPVKDWNPDSCTLCKFLVDLLARASERFESARDPYFLFSKKTRSLSDKLFQILDHRLVVLSASENGLPPEGVPYIAAYSGEPPQWLRHIQPLIDFDRPRGWLGVCAQLHGEHCSGDKNNKVQSLRLMNCSTGEVIRAEGHEPYVALSYVWGGDHGSAQGTHAYPQTIQDALVATRELGYQWLWVDQYCIDQANPGDFRNQLQQMDIIYQQAEVTIIAAAGTNAHYGLPGVGASFRKPTSTVSVHEEQLCVLPRPEIGLEKCRWSSRAWTYQEGLLSTRRLVFTEEQLYFECQCCYCAEMLDITLESFKKMHAPEKPWLHKRYRTAGRLGMFPLNGCGVDPWDIYNRITEYSERSLSHEYDILNGILGIFRAFEKMENPMRHLFGIPFPKATSCPNETKLFASSKRALPTFSESLRWDLESPSRRREGFPSWSWTGWYGKIKWPVEYIDVDVIRTPKRLGRPLDPKVNEKALLVCVELHNNTLTDWSEFQGSYDKLCACNESSGFIELEVHATKVFYSPNNMQRSHFSIPCENGSLYVVPASMTTVNDLHPDHGFLAIHYHRTVEGNQGRNSGIVLPPKWTQHLLIVQDMGSHWERVAIASYIVDPEHKVMSRKQRVRLG
ncbi:HET-domain-containing protein [Bimuria novae-zelandiae CBS 107.79]|uniref:HET-domain-containing protein n=1 Tax=Bimuria novae-zelandiae CBS 107.79 TaxID=1447943 RepID=A0A6A5UL37_9PLEO|nr:HET-domain-containing protein [Bimuria novae-zelandiae CBS 107.79]